MDRSYCGTAQRVKRSAPHAATTPASTSAPSRGGIRFVDAQIMTFSNGSISGLLRFTTIAPAYNSTWIEITAMPGGLDGLAIGIKGSVVEDGFEGTYVIEGLAEGTWNAAAIP